MATLPAGRVALAAASRPGRPDPESGAILPYGKDDYHIIPGCLRGPQQQSPMPRGTRYYEE